MFYQISNGQFYANGASPACGSTWMDGPCQKVEVLNFHVEQWGETHWVAYGYHHDCSLCIYAQAKGFCALAERLVEEYGIYFEMKYIPLKGSAFWPFYLVFSTNRTLDVRHNKSKDYSYSLQTDTSSSNN